MTVLGSLRAALQRYSRPYRLSLAVALFFFTSMHLLTAPLPLYVAHLGGNAVAVGLVSGLFAGSALLSRVPVGWLADRTRRWWLLLAGCGIYVLASLGYLVARSVPAVLALRVFHGVGISLFTTGYTALAADLSPADRRGEALGLAGTAGPLTLLFAPALGDGVRLAFGFGPAFLLAAVAALGGLGLLALLPRHSGHAPSSPASRGVSRGLRLQDVPWDAVLGLAACGSAFSALYAFMPAFAVERNQVTAAPFFAAFSLALIGARVFLGAGSDRWGRRAVVLPSLAAMALALWVVATTQNWMWMVAAGLLAGAGQGAARAALEAAAVDGANAARRGWAVNAAWLGFDLGIAVGSVAWGPVAEALGYGPMFGVAGAVGFLLAGVLALGPRR
jgi:MFS family permease